MFISFLKKLRYVGQKSYIKPKSAFTNQYVKNETQTTKSDWMNVTKFKMII